MMGKNAPTRKLETTVSIVIYTPFRIVMGILYLPPSIRLSDRLNVVEDDFITLQDPRIIDLKQGWMEPILETKPWFLHRQEILVLHAITSTETQVSAVGIPAERVPKHPVPIRAYIGRFRLEGNLHLPPDTDIATHLNQAQEPFFPLTSARISFPSQRDLDVVQVPFVLVNRSHLVISLREDTP